MNSPFELRGFKIYKDFLSQKQQEGIVDALRAVQSAAPLFSPMTTYGKPMSVGMTSAGKYGWVSDKSGYRYAAQHPNGSPWPDIPDPVLQVWDALIDPVKRPECCLINYYREGARMGMHQDRDEVDFDWPVLSVSLGDEGLFRIGNSKRGGKTDSLWLSSGDVVVMGGAARLCYHGIDRIRFGSSTLLKRGGRLNLTLRVVD